MRYMRYPVFLALLFTVSSFAEIRVGIIGTDTSHVPTFTRTLNDATAADHIPGARVVAAYKGGSADVESSASRVEKYAEARACQGCHGAPMVYESMDRRDALLREADRLCASAVREVAKLHEAGLLARRHHRPAPVRRRGLPEDLLLRRHHRPRAPQYPL